VREKPLKLEQLQILKCRTVVGGADVNELVNLNLGWEGECELDVMIDWAIRGRNCIHMKDYRFAVNGEVQIDNVLIAGDRIFTFEVKKYNFDLIYSDEVWTFTNGEKFKNLMQQVSRQNDAFRHLVQRFGGGKDVYSCLVFINPGQMIYNLPYGKNILTASSLGKFLDRIVRDNHYSYDRLAGFLESRRVTKSMYDGAVTVDFDELRGGVFCDTCYEELERVGRDCFSCPSCNQDYDLLGVIQRLIHELRILNSDWPINSLILSKYSGNQISSSYIRTQKRLGNLKY
jgi:hypothetical protein